MMDELFAPPPPVASVGRAVAIKAYMYAYYSRHTFTMLLLKHREFDGVFRCCIAAAASAENPTEIKSSDILIIYMYFSFRITDFYDRKHPFSAGDLFFYTRLSLV